MKPLLLSLVSVAALLGASLLRAQAPAEFQDPIVAAIAQASEVQPNPPPDVTTIAAQTAPAPAVAPSAASPLPETGPVVPAVPGGDNAVFTAPGETAHPGSIVGRLAPGLAQDAALDALTKERARIRLIGDYEAQFRGAALGDVVRALAEHAQMRYIAPLNDSLSTPVSIAGTYNLLDLLDVIQEHYGVSLSFDRGIWRIAKTAPDSLIMKAYALKHNNREAVDITSPVINSIGNAGGVTGGNQSGVSGQGDSSTSNASFKVSYDGLTKDIENLLTAPIPLADGKEDRAPAASGSKAFYVAETNEIMVLASKYHHELVRDYIERIDQPVDQIEFSAFFVQSSNSPSRNLGLDWGDGPSINVDVSGANPEPLSKFTIPRAGILNEYQFTAALRFSAEDSKGSVFQSPTVVGMPNRKTVLDATEQIPVAQSTFNTGGSNASTSTSSSIQYIDVGTIVNIYPTVRKTPDGGKIIRLNVSLVVSALDGFTTINGNPTPKTNRRRFEFTAEVPEGQTLAIGGLVSSSSTRTSNKIPFLGDMPVAGRLFRNDQDTASRSNMVVYITPRILNGTNSSLGKKLARVWPADDRFDRPVFDRDQASLPSVRASLAGFGRELDAVETYIDQHRDPAQISERIASLRGELDGMGDYIKALRKEGVVVDAALTREIDALASRASSLRRTILLATRL